jgi:hypothetical protein
LINNEKPKKRLIIFLLTAVVLFIYLIFAFLYFVPLVGFKNLPAFVDYIFFTMLFGIPTILTFLVLILVISILRGKDFFIFKKVRLIAIKIFYPLVVLIGNILKIDTDKIRDSFIEINNSLLKNYEHSFNKNEVLILLPHCLQNFDCQFKITNNIENCKLCGKCKIKDIIEITSLYGIHAAIATGGTMARKLIKDHRPKFIIAVACERDLASGIQDAFPLPVYGITNKRPFGPCFNTDINIKKLKAAIEFFLKNNYK